MQKINAIWHKYLSRIICIFRICLTPDPDLNYPINCASTTYLPDFADEIMQPVTHGETYQEALQAGLEVMDELILCLQAEGKVLPTPRLVSA